MEITQEYYKDEILSATNKIITEFEETRDDFIYTTILPYCNEVVEQKLSKERLKKILILGLEKEMELEKEEE